MKEGTVKITSFHAHVYFDPATREMAARVRSGLEDFDVRLGRWHDKLIGPHLKPMYQVAFSPEQFSKVVPWLMLNREQLDILVHPETGNDLKDHTEHALWLGEKLELNTKVLQ